MQALSLSPIVVPLATKLDGINAVRRTLPRAVFHSRCEDVGISALEQYRREWDDERKVFRANEVHDWTSHLADAFRYLSLAWQGQPVAKLTHRDSRPQHGRPPLILAEGVTAPPLRMARR